MIYLFEIQPFLTVSIKPKRSIAFLIVLVALLTFPMTFASAEPSQEPSQATPPVTNAASTPSPSPQPLGLPPPEATTGRAHKVDLSSGSADLSDALGPLVINKDGTTARITNWADMTAGERERTLRIITRRNRQRLQQLKDEL